MCAKMLRGLTVCDTFGGRQRRREFVCERIRKLQAHMGRSMGLSTCPPFVPSSPKHRHTALLAVFAFTDR